MKETLLDVQNVTVQLSGKMVLEGISFSISEGEMLAVIGPSGSGKSTLLKILAGNYLSKGAIRYTGNPKIITIAQQHYFKNLSNTSSFYYQQRFNSADAEDALTVLEALAAEGFNELHIDEVLSLLHASHVKNTRLIQLSNGEHKRFQLAKGILHQADWLLLDNPFIGLDISARKLLNQILDNLFQKGIKLFLVTSVSEIPDAVTHIALLNNGKLMPVITRREFIESQKTLPVLPGVQFIHAGLLDQVIPAYTYPDFTVAIKMVNTNVIYHNRTILHNINWEVKKGECWSLSGHNGSGKSTLLSLVNGDNPQAFANEIYLFDRKKGTGETIWDIKQKIGYVSPELHHYFDAAVSCFEVVASGLFDTIGLFKIISEKQKAIVNQWMDILSVKRFEKRTFKQLSNGEQRLVLLARALVKNPPLLILDEPCQGLDDAATKQFIALINDICVHLKKTLVYVTHYQQEIPACINRSLQLANGRIAA